MENFGALSSAQLKNLSIVVRSAPTEQTFYIVTKGDTGDNKCGEIDSGPMKCFSFGAANHYYYFDNYWHAWACSLRLLKKCKEPEAA